ncbi:MAG: hypothetical protein C4534_06060 [Gaiellales bacterium]|nr:MAG: hypothetical protein C4534_06060 [Gaiellales bacterium]
MYNSILVTLTDRDLHFVVTRIPRDVRSLMKKYPQLVLAGGFIRATVAREKVSDVDMFGPSEEYLDKAATELALSRKGRVYKSKNAITVLAPPRMPVQFITRWLYDDPVGVVNSFDYTICQAAVYVRDLGFKISDKQQYRWESWCSPLFYPDLACKRLTYMAPERNEDAGGSILRMRKYLSRGYIIQADSMAMVIARLVKGVDWKDAKHWQDEEYSSKVICGLLREVDPLVAIDGIDMIDEHEIDKEEGHDATEKMLDDH